MSLKKVRQVKADKGFKIWDLLVYGIIIALAVVLFIVVFATRDTSPLTGIQVYCANEVVFEYNFEKSEYKIYAPESVEITEETQAAIFLTVNVGDSGYNKIEIYKEGRVKMVSANCGKKECVYSPEIKDNSRSIDCFPHRLKIIPYNFDIDNGNIKL